ncbi:MAG: PAS domain S-box protein [Chloroflexi bacterium]|nr:PAS domain S-box protein [Chloroflexota bacterium]
MTTLMPRGQTQYRIVAAGEADLVWVMDLDYRPVLASHPSPQLAASLPIACGSDSTLAGAVNRMLPGLCTRIAAVTQAIASSRLQDLSSSWVMEMPIPTTDGAMLLTETSISLVYDSDGAPSQLVCVTRDKYQRREQQAIFRTVAPTSPLGVYIIQDGKFEFVNFQFQRYAKFTQTELVGANAMSFVVPADRDMVRHMSAAMLAGRRFEPYEFRFVCKDGEVRWLMETVAPIIHHGRRGILGTFLDITERKQAEEELRQSESHLSALTARMLGVQEMERSRFARDLHDQLGQDLVFLKIQAASLASQLGSVPSLQCQAQELATVAERLGASSRRIAANIGPGIVDGLGLARAVEWCAEDFEKRTGISCPVDAPTGDLSAGQTTAMAIYRILQESLTNVWKHAKASQADVRMYSTGGQVILEVADNGIGLNARLASSKPTLGILGMYERARLAGGTLSISSVSGSGTRIVARLPLETAR